MLYVPLDFKSRLRVDALVDLGAYVSAIVEKDLDKNEQQAPIDILKLDDPHKFSKPSSKWPV